MNFCELVIYTTGGALSFDVVAPCDDFRGKLAEALEAGLVVLDTAEGSQLVLNAVNVVAVEIKETKSEGDIPPGVEKARGNK